MPNILEVEGIGQIKMPDEWSPEQIQEWAQTRLPRVREDLQRSRVSETPARVLRDIGSAGWDTVKGLARGFLMHRDALVEDAMREVELTGQKPPMWKSADELAKEHAVTREARLAESPAYKLAEEQQKEGQEFYRTNPKLEETIPSQLIRAGATTLPILAAGATGPAAPLVGAGLYGAMAGQQGATEAIEKGHPEKADEAYLAFAGLGAISEAALGYPLALLRSVQAARRAGVKPEQFGRQFRTTLAEAGNRIGREILEGAGREAAQESTEQAGQNVAARMIGYDPTRPLTKNVWEAFWLGGAVGGLFGSVAGTARAIDESPRNQFGRLVEEEMLRPMEQQRTPGVVGKELVDALTRAQMNPETAQRTFVPAMLAQPQAPPTGVTLSEAPPAPPQSARELAEAAMLRELRLEGVSEPDAIELIRGTKRPEDVVGTNFGARWGFVPRDDTDDAARGHSEAMEAGMRQAEERLYDILGLERPRGYPAPPAPPEPAPVPEPPVRRRSPAAPAREQPRFAPPGVRPVPVPPPTPEVPSAVPVSYEDAQARIDAIEDRLEAQGANVIRLFNPTAPEAKLLAESPEWKPMPPELVQAYAARDAIGAKQFKESVQELTSRLKPLGFSDREIKRVLSDYGIDTEASDAIAQNHATEHAPKLVRVNPLEQAQKVAITLAAERNEMFDELKDVSKKTLQDAAKAVGVLREYFGLPPTAVTQLQETPYALRQRTPEKISLGQTPEDRPPLVQEIRQPEEPARAQAAQAPGTVTPKSPLQRDWDALKAQAPDHLLAVRLGDFYEFFNQDARDVAKAARVALTKRNNVEMAGIPAHAGDSYFNTLRGAGFNVAIVDTQDGGKRRITERLPAGAAQAPVKRFQDWRVQGNIIRHSGVGKRLTQAEANDIRDVLADYNVSARFDNTKGVVVINGGLLADAIRAWEEQGSPAKSAAKRQAAKEVREAGKADTETARQSELATLPAAKWIDEIFGADAMNVFNKLALARYLDGKAPKFEGQANPKWNAGLAKLDAVNLQDVKEAYGASRTVTPPAAVQQEAQAQVSQTAAVQGQRAAKEVKSELVQRLEEALAAAPALDKVQEHNLNELQSKLKKASSAGLDSARKALTAFNEQFGKITIDIPGDGTFVIYNTKQAIGEVLKRAERLSTTAGPRLTREQQAARVETEGQWTPEDQKDFERRSTQQKQQAKRRRSKHSVTLKDTPTAGVTSADIAAAFPASQGFAVKAVAISFPNEPDTTGFLVILPNGETILIDPRRDTIAFDAAKSAADWGLDPADVAERGIAVGKWTANGVTIPGLSRTGLIELINTAGPDTLSHEKFHALFELALTPEDRAAILNRYKTEEKAAEAFRRSEGFTRGFWDTMRRFIEWLANLVRGDAFRQLRAPLREDFVSQPLGRTDPQLSLKTVFSSPANFQRFLDEKVFLSDEEKASLRQQAGAQAALVPDSIAAEIEALNPEDAVEKRMASMLNFVTQIHGLGPALELNRVLADPTIDAATKDAAIGGVLTQVQRVEVNAKEIDDKLQDSIKTMASLMKARGRIEKQHLIEERSKQIAQNLVAGYKAYLTAQAATLPADSNVAAARQSLLRRMEGAINEVTRLPDATMRALEAIAERISELPVNEGPQAVIDAIRMKDILRGKVGDSTIEMLTEEKPGGLPPLLLNPGINQALIELADLQRNADKYAKQIEVVEQAFRGKGEPTPVQLRKWAETYRKFRNKQADAAKAIAEYDESFKKADEDLQVYGRSGDVLDRLQSSPEYQAQMRLALGRPGGEIRSDLYQDAAARKKEGDLTKETVYVSPLKHIVTDEEGKETEKQNTFRVHLAPHIQADRAAVEQMQLLVEEIERYLAGENGPVDPISERTWSERRDYLKQYVIHPKFLQEDAGSTWANPFRWLRIFFGGLSDSLRGEFGKLGLRAAEEAEREVLTSEFAATGYRNLANNEEIGDASTNVATIAAVKSHGWETDRIKFWNQYVLNPIVAAGQTAGQMRLQKGDYIPGTDIQITPEDIAVARMEKRFSQGIVQTTQGTAKGSPALLRMNPVLIEDRFSGKPVLRGAMSPGPLTMARSFSTWGRGFDLQWHGDQTHVPTPEERRRMVQDGDNFQMAVLGYIRTTNPEFENNSPLLKVYEAFAKNGKDDPSYKVNSMDQLLDKLADIAVEQGLFENKADASPSIEATLMKEIGEHITAIRAQFAEDHPGSETVPQQVMQFASSQNAFTKPRKRMVAPDPYYDYTLTHESDRISFVAAALQQFQSRIITKMEALQNALELQQRALDKEIDELYNRGMGERKARKTVTERTARKLGALRFSYEQLLEHKRRLDKLVDQMKALVIDSRNPNDSPLIAAWTRGQTLLSSGLLANPTAIGNNLAGGILSGKNITLWNLGQGRSFWNPKTHARLVSETIKKLLRAVPGTPIERLARSNMPLVKDMAGWVNDMLLEQIQREADAEAAGLISRADLANRLKARGELMTSAGQIDYESPKGVAAVINAAGSLPGVRYALGQLRDKIPGAFDRFMNTNNSRFYQDSLFLDLKNLAIKAFRTREEIAARTGRSLDEINDFSQEANLLTPKELNRPKASGYRDAGRLRQLFNSIGSLDAFLLDYYTRYKAAPEGEKADVPLFPDPADEGAVIYDLESHENLATSGFTPLAFQGVGQRGLIKKLLFMFKNYPTRLFEQMSRMLATDPRDPKVKRELHNWFGVLTLLIISALAGLLGKEAASPIQQAITGRSPSFVKLSNVLENPDAGMLARYVGMGLASNLPYYGGVISQILGNPGYGTWLDAAEYIPAAGLVKDAGLAVRRTAQTGDPIFPATDFIARWFPPASPALRLIPDVAGDIEGRNAARALRVVGPSAGMELAGGAGATYKQTPATLETRRLLAAAYRGDAEGIKEAFDAAVRERAAAGSADPERAVMQSIAAAVPARRVFGRSITAGEEAQLTSLMSAGGRADYAKSRDAFDLINRTLGTTTSLTSQPRARRTTGGRRRRSLRGGSRLPRIRRVRSRRGRSRRRSPFGFRQPTARRRRRSPTFSTAA